MGHVTDAPDDEVASAQSAVDARIEQCHIPHLVIVLKMDADGLESLGLLTRALSLLPGFPDTHTIPCQTRRRLIGI